MLNKIFLSFIGLVFLAVIIDVSLICGFYVLANSLSKENNQTSMMISPETPSDTKDIFEF